MLRLAFWLPFTLLLLIAGLSFWLDQQVAQEDSVFGLGKNKTSADFILEGYSVVKLDETGHVQYRMNGQTLSHFRDLSQTQLQNVHWVHYQPGAPALTITSNQGTVLDNGKQIDLAERVIVHREADANQRNMQLTTAQLSLWPDSNLAKTNAPVRIESHGSITTATGMELNSKTRVLQLHKAVKATFPAKTKS